MKPDNSHKLRRILLIEDNSGDVVLIREALKESKFQCDLTVVNNGSQAIELLKEIRKNTAAPLPELILLDLNLPRKNGREVLAEIKSDNRLRTIPVIVLTSSEAEQDIQSSYLLHANCYITKPTDFDAYIRIIKLINEFWFNTVKLPPQSVHNGD